MQHMVDNVLLIKYNSNQTYFSLFVLCSLPQHFIISCPHLAEFDPIPALYQKGFSTWNLTVQQFIRSKLKCILFVCPNVADNLLLLPSSPHLLCPSQQYLSITGWRVAFSVGATPANEKCAYSRMRLVNGSSVCVWVSVCRSLTKCYFTKCSLKITKKKKKNSFQKLIFGDFLEGAEKLTHLIHSCGPINSGT